MPSNIQRRHTDLLHQVGRTKTGPSIMGAYVLIYQSLSIILIFHVQASLGEMVSEQFYRNFINPNQLRSPRSRQVSRSLLDCGRMCIAESDSDCIVVKFEISNSSCSMFNRPTNITEVPYVQTGTVIYMRSDGRELILGIEY